jgi:hypothetical protein
MAMDQLSLQFLEITLQIANCREDTRETVSLLIASSARQSALYAPSQVRAAFTFGHGPDLNVRRQPLS